MKLKYSKVYKNNINWLSASEANPFYVNKLLLEKLAPSMNIAYTKHELMSVHFPALKPKGISVLLTKLKWYFLRLEAVSTTIVIRLRITVNFVL